MWLVLAQFGIEIEIDGDDSCVRVKNTRQSSAITGQFSKIRPVPSIPAGATR
jgi:hypothetical protein